VKATLTKNSKYMDWIIREHKEVELCANSIQMGVGFPQGVKKASHSHPAGTKKCSFKEQGLMNVTHQLMHFQYNNILV